MRLLFLSMLLVLSSCGKDGKDGAPGTTGATGAKGADAPPTAYTVTSIIDPCGDAAGVVDEVLLKLANGQVLVSFSASSSGNNTRLAVLPPGNYVTTDGSNCHFTLTNDGQVL